MGTRNELRGAHPWNEIEWKKNFQDISDSGMKQDPDPFIGEFMDNPIKRKLLLKELTEQQKRVFDYCGKHRDDDYEFNQAAAELDLPEDIFMRHYEAILNVITKIDSELSLEQSKRFMEEAEEIRKKLSI